MTTTQEFSLVAIRPGSTPADVTVTPGTTVAQLAAELGIANAESMTALDGHQRAIGPNDVIDPETTALSFIYKIAGA